MSDLSFFSMLDQDHFVANKATIGPWSPNAQHGGPPCALLIDEMMRRSPGDGREVAKISIEFLRPVPLGKVEVKVREVRGGYKVSLVEGELIVDGTASLMARMWWRRGQLGRSPEVQNESADVLTPVQFHQLPVAPLVEFPYISNIEWRFERGGFYEMGDARVHCTPRIPLVFGREASGVSEMLLMLDSANGLSQVLPIGRWTFVPVDMMVSLLSLPTPSVPFTLDAKSEISETGGGITRCTVTQGGRLIARSLQSLFVEPRG
ncbi:MAG: thioesterase family protein [Actinomycetota bacterium]|nr:thioesterase family protein [Actinomycetota bacterium]